MRNRQLVTAYSVGSRVGPLGQSLRFSKDGGQWIVFYRIFRMFVLRSPVLDRNGAGKRVEISFHHAIRYHMRKYTEQGINAEVSLSLSLLDTLQRRRAREPTRSNTKSPVISRPSQTNRMVASDDSSDGQSDECLLSSGGDDLSSVNGQDFPSHVVAGNLPGVISLDTSENHPREHSFWNSDADLFRLVQSMVAKHNAKDDQKKRCEEIGVCRRRLATPSAAQAESQSQDWLLRIADLVEERGNETQRQMWNSASPEERHEIVSAFFLPYALGGMAGGSG